MNTGPIVPKEQPVIIQSELIHQFRNETTPRITDPKYVLKALFQKTGPDITVYPSEFYWYFQIPLQGAWVKGTIVWGLEDPDSIELSFYVQSRNFLPDGKENFVSGSKDGWGGNLAKDLGCKVGGIEKDATGLIRRIDCFGISKIFHYPFVNRDLEANRSKLREREALLPGEQHWGDFIDESGLRFSAIFLPEEKMFVEVLHPDDERLLRLVHYPKQQVYHDGNTDFVFYKEGKRLVLIGVYKFSVMENSMNDGPHDQLPHADMWAGNIEMIGKFIPKLSKYRPELESDDFGNLKKFKNARFVITEHFNYEHINDFSYVPKCLNDRKRFHACIQGGGKH